jgi:VanZ family protein
MDGIENMSGAGQAGLSPLRYLLRYWLPVAVWMLVIFSASGDSQSVQRSDSLLARLLGWIHLYPTSSQLEMMRWIIRKGAHLTEYAILAGLCWRALQARFGLRQWSSTRALSICAAYAVTDEIHQSFVKDRNGSAVDVGIDTLGAALGLVVLWRIVSRLRALR